MSIPAVIERGEGGTLMVRAPRDASYEADVRAMFPNTIRSDRRWADAATNAAMIRRLDARIATGVPAP